MPETLAVVAALAFAVGNVLQQRGTLEASEGKGYGTFLTELFHRPVWVVGLTLQISGWLFQAVALDKGSLVVVQSICALSIVLALPFGARLTAQRITRQVVIGATFTLVGIIVFLSIGAPRGGTSHPSADVWWVACVGILAVVGGIALLGQMQTGAPRALLFGAAAGFGFALQAAVTKQLVGEIDNGILALVRGWPIYVLIATALVGFILWQLALRTDVLAPAMASSNAATLFAGVLLGIIVYGETLHHGATTLVPALLGLALALLGVVLLSTAPPPMEPAAVIRAPPRPSSS